MSICGVVESVTHLPVSGTTLSMTAVRFLTASPFRCGDAMSCYFVDDVLAATCREGEWAEFDRPSTTSLKPIASNFTPLDFDEATSELGRESGIDDRLSSIRMFALQLRPDLHLSEKHVRILEQRLQITKEVCKVQKLPSRVIVDMFPEELRPSLMMQLNSR